VEELVYTSFHKHNDAAPKMIEAMLQAKHPDPQNELKIISIEPLGPINHWLMQ
jgi:hypothetical protein